MGYFIVEDNSGNEYFVEDMVAGMALLQIPNGQYVRVATQTDIEAHWDQVQEAEPKPQVSRVFSSPE